MLHMNKSNKQLDSAVKKLSDAARGLPAMELTKAERQAVKQRLSEATLPTTYPPEKLRVYHWVPGRNDITTHEVAACIRSVHQFCSTFTSLGLAISACRLVVDNTGSVRAGLVIMQDGSRALVGTDDEQSERCNKFSWDESFARGLIEKGYVDPMSFLFEPQLTQMADRQVFAGMPKKTYDTRMSAIVGAEYVNGFTATHKFAAFLE